MKNFSIVMLSLLILVIVFLAAYLIFIRTLFWVFLRRKNPAKRIEKNDEIKKKYQLDLDWLKNKKDQMLTVLSEDGLKLKGHFFDFGKKKTAILVHGYSNDWREMANYAKIFAKFDFNILIVEQRAHGKSQGLIITMGIEEGRDLICWARCLKEEKRQSQIILFGVSMGGTSVLFSVGEKENHNFDLAICDSAFSNIFQQVIHFGKSKFGKLSNKVVKIFANYSKRAYDIDFENADFLNNLRNFKKPILILHGGDDDFVKIENAFKIYEKIENSNKEILIIKNAKHCQGLIESPRVYEQKILSFLRKNGI